MILKREDRVTQIETGISVTLSTTKTKWSGLASNPVLRGERSATNKNAMTMPNIVSETDALHILSKDTPGWLSFFSDKSPDFHLLLSVLVGIPEHLDASLRLYRLPINVVRLPSYFPRSIAVLMKYKVFVRVWHVFTGLIIRNTGYVSV